MSSVGLSAGPARARLAATFATFALLVLLPAWATSGAALGPSISLTAGPPNVTGYPTPDSGGVANFTGAVQLFSNPVASATLAVAITSQLGWTVTPSTMSWRVMAAGQFPFNFTVEIPPDAAFDLVDAINVAATYKVGGVTTASDSATVHATAAGYYGASARRLTPPTTMETGKTYLIEYDLQNTGNAPASFAFVWADPSVNDKTRATFALPQGVTLAGFGNATVQFSVTPTTTSPGGTFGVPVRLESRDKQGTLQATANFTMEVEIVNAPIFLGIFPNFSTHGLYTLASYAFVLLIIWFGLRVAVALVRARGLDPSFGPRFPRALGASVRGSLLVRGALRVLRARPKGLNLKRGPKRPDEVRGAAAARASGRR